MRACGGFEREGAREGGLTPPPSFHVTAAAFDSNGMARTRASARLFRVHGRELTVGRVDGAGTSHAAASEADRRPFADARLPAAASSLEMKSGGSSMARRAVGLWSGWPLARKTKVHLFLLERCRPTKFERQFGLGRVSR